MLSGFFMSGDLEILLTNGKTKELMRKILEIQGEVYH